MLPQPEGGSASGQKARQAEFFDDEADPEFEVTRPHGTPAFHGHLLQEKFRRSIRGLEGLLPGATVLTVCGGSGMDAEALARAGAEVIASDISPKAAARALERGRRFGVPLAATVADVEQLPFADRAIDLVYVHDGLHHIERPDAGLEEMARVARRAVSVTEPAVAAATAVAVRLGVALEEEEAGNRVARMTLDGVGATLARCGFRVVHSERYAMFYRHEPGAPTRFLSRGRLAPLTMSGYRLASRTIGRAGNKLVVTALRD